MLQLENLSRNSKVFQGRNVLQMWHLVIKAIIVYLIVDGLITRVNFKDSPFSGKKVRTLSSTSPHSTRLLLATLTTKLSAVFLYVRTYCTMYTKTEHKSL